MLLHFLRLLARAFVSVPGALGSTWLGIVFPVAIALLGELIGVFLFGWAAMKQNWRRTTGIGFAALGIGYTILFLIMVISTTYTDHVNLVATVTGFKNRLQEAQTALNQSVSAVTKEKDEEIGKLKENCAYQSGAAGAFQEQIGGLQGQLNACIVQQKEVPIIRSFMIFRDARPGVPRMEYFLTTNVVRTPAKFVMSCDIPIADSSVSPMTETGASTSSIGQNRISANSVKVDMESPAWSPASPLGVIIYFNPPVSAMPRCSFSAD